MRGIKNIIFDLGGVIMDLDIPTSLKAFSKIMVHPVGTLEEAIATLRPLMHAMDVGEMEADTFISIMKEQCHPGVTDEEIVDAFNQIIRLPRHRLEWILELRKHYRVFLLSNIGDLHWRETQRQSEALGIDFASCFDEMFLSYKMKLAKPDIRIYERLIAETGIQPSETLYIDDLPNNIEAGRTMGLISKIVPTNEMDEELKKLFPEILS